MILYFHGKATGRPITHWSFKMTKFIYDTKSIMTRAWSMARELRAQWAIKEQRHSKWARSNMNLRKCFEISLRNAWEEAKAAMTQAVKVDAVKAFKNTQSQKPATTRYVELVVVAERNKLNHGKAWRCSSYDVDFRGMHPMHEGEMVCYVYNN